MDCLVCFFCISGNRLPYPFRRQKPEIENVTTIKFIPGEVINGLKIPSDFDAIDFTCDLKFNF